MIFTLDDERALDVAQAGAKASWLARGRNAGLPVLPGVVLGASVSVPYLELGSKVLEDASSGAARLAIVGADQPAEIEALETAAADMEPPMVVRSSSILEGSGAWSGAFTSYLDLQPGELGIGVLGCWASVFSASTLERYEATGIEPTQSPMAVLVQPALECDFGGTARMRGDSIEIVGIRGNPGPLVQGWEPGVAGTVEPDGTVSGAGLVELLGIERAQSIASLLERAASTIGATNCEWGMADDEVTFFQLARSPQEPPGDDHHVPEALRTDVAGSIAAVVRRHPGSFGEELVLPWAVGPTSVPPMPAVDATTDIAETLDMARQIAATLTAQVWGQPKPKAATAATAALRNLRGTDPAEAVDAISRLGRADEDQVGLLMQLIGSIAAAMVGAGTITVPELVWHLDPRLVGSGEHPRLDRVGFDRWEPFTTTVVGAAGTQARGASAAPGIASGRMCRVLDSDDLKAFRPRDVLVSTHPVPNLAPLLWDAAAVVTTGGSPAAHLFESARALAIPAVSGVRLEDILGKGLTEGPIGEFVLAVDGSSGTVTGMEW